MLQELKFPPRALFTDAVYIPLFIEPVVGSGERLCFGVALKFGDEQKFLLLPGIKRLFRIYGPAGKALEFAINLAKNSLDGALRMEGLVALSHWRSPVEGIILGEKRITSARTIEDCARIAFSQCASLFETTTIAEQTKEQAFGRRFARLTLTRLEKVVADEVIKQRPALHASFSQRFQVSPNARSTRVGFVGPHLVANFGILVPTNLQSLVDSAKARLLDLERLREEKKETLFATPTSARFELFMKRVTLENVEYSESQIKTVDEAAEELSFLSRKSGVFCQAYKSPEDIVQAILEAEAA